MVTSQYHYTYTKDLLVLDSRKSNVQLKDIPTELRQVRTPLMIKEWESNMREHPDREFCEYLLCGMVEGFRVGFQYPPFMHVSKIQHEVCRGTLSGRQ